MIIFSGEKVMGVARAFMGSSDFPCNRIRGCGRMSALKNIFGHRQDTGPED
ncbi:MAG: hypothetical protein WAW39_21425 [Prosthecobacter sp.]|uniref:hypothetical protein n=1 Tax=Prosthecobacter sp. TaxID=1965333 RepID=UPI003BB1620F